MSSKTLVTRKLCTDAPARKLASACRAHTRIATAMVGMFFFAGAHAGTSGNISLASDHVFRGVSQTNQDPALQGGIEYAADRDVYAGTWGSNSRWLSDASSTLAPISSSLELDLYGGYRGTFNDAVSFDVGALYYWYPGDFPNGFNSADTVEVRAGVTDRNAMPSCIAGPNTWSISCPIGSWNAQSQKPASTWRWKRSQVPRRPARSAMEKSSP